MEREKKEQKAAREMPLGLAFYLVFFILCYYFVPDSDSFPVGGPEETVYNQLVKSTSSAAHHKAYKRLLMVNFKFSLPEAFCKSLLS